MYEIFDYQTEDGHDPYKEWLADLADRQARARVAVRVQRMAAGNFGDHKPLTDGVWELRIDPEVSPQIINKVQQVERRSSCLLLTKLHLVTHPLLEEMPCT
jgi:putative addiction module killer protein